MTHPTPMGRQQNDSIFLYGTLFAVAPQYSGQGGPVLQ